MKAIRKLSSYEMEKNLPTELAHNVDTTLIQRQDVESTLNRSCFNVVCPLGSVSSSLN